MDSDKIILDLCGGTGSWSKPYKDAGYDVRVITFPEHDVTKYKPPKGVYGILAAPPCTEFSVLNYTGLRKQDYRKGLEIVDACLAIIRECQLGKGLSFWALENPRGQLRKFLGTPPYTFEHWWFGGTSKKPTDIWGDYDFPAITQVFRPTRFSTIEDGYSENKLPEGYTTGDYGKDDKRSARRSMTPAGFARAFFLANQ